MLDRADCTGPTRQHELDDARSGTDLPFLADRDREVATDDLYDLSEMRTVSVNQATTYLKWLETATAAVVLPGMYQGIYVIDSITSTFQLNS